MHHLNLFLVGVGDINKVILAFMMFNEHLDM